MKWRYCIWVLVLVLYSCKKAELELRTNPFFPNTRATVENAEKWGFQLADIDHGICLYEKQLDEQSQMYFLLDSKDQCTQVNGQGLTIALGVVDYAIPTDTSGYMDYNKCFKQNLFEFRSDSTKIASILNDYSCVQLSKAQRLGGSETVVFKAYSEDGEYIDCWYSVNSQTKQKQLTMESFW